MFTSWLDGWMLRALRRLSGPVPVRFALRDHADPGPDPAAPTVRFHDRRTVARVLLHPEVGFGEAYAAGSLTIDGPLLDALTPLYTARVRTWYSRLASAVLRFAQDNSLRGSRRNIQRHYDLPTDFYQLWLDPALVYTCAYFPQPDVSLEEAQRAKLEHVCRKLALQRGERVAEAGCGWGALALYMARQYGVRVTAFNISREQVEYARAAAARAGLAGQVEFVEDDYRNIGPGYDVFVSVGMLEHVGRERYARFGRAIQRAIGNSGRGLLHFIGRDAPRPFSAWIRKRIFPGAYAPSLREALLPLEREGFSVLDVENLRRHYARTLEHWLERYERCFELVERRFGPEFARAWRLYLAGSIVGFRTGTLQLFQVLFAGRECRVLPWTRAHLYRDTPAWREDTWDRMTS